MKKPKTNGSWDGGFTPRRTGVFEILMINDEIRQLLVSGASATQIRSQAIKDGLINIAKDGMLKAKAGITTPHEVLRNAYSTA